MRQCVVEVDHNIGRLALSYQKAAEALGAWKKGQIDRAFGAKKDFKHAASGKIPRDLETSLNEGIAALESYQTKNNLARSGGEKLTPGTPGRPIEVPFERTVEQTFDRAQPVGPQKRDGSPRSSARPNSAGQRRPRKLQRKR